MRKIVFLCIVCCAFFNMPRLLDAQSLDEAIIAAAVKISRDLPADSKAAIINFNSSSENLNKYVIEEFNGNLLRNRRIVPVVPDQNQLNNIQRELRFNEAGDVEAESAQSIGRMLGVGYIITGSLVQRIGNEYDLLLNAYDTTQAKLQSQYTALLSLQNDQHFSVLLGIAAPRVSQTTFLKEDSWKNKRVYLGGGLGLGHYTYYEEKNFDYDYGDVDIDKRYREINYPTLSVFFMTDFVLLDFLSIGVSIDYGIPFYLSIPLMAKFGGKFGKVELSGNLGYTIPALWHNAWGFTFGGTFGIKAGNGIIFLDISAIPQSWGESYTSSSSFHALVGYKIGVGGDRK